MKRVAILDGSLHGQGGNTYGVIQELISKLPKTIDFDYIELKNIDDALTLESRIRAADGYILGTGTYWQSWGSPLQRFLEQTTVWEATDVWLGKPLCTIVTMHSVGGMEVLSRLQANFALLGTLIPPMCCLVHSHVNQMALSANETNRDIWDLSSLDTIAHNFKVSLFGKQSYMTWDVDREEIVTGVWFKKDKK